MLSLKKRFGVYLSVVFLLIFCNPLSLFANKITFRPNIKITETYTDNYNSSSNKEKEEEFYTRYETGFYLHSATRKSSSNISYSPSYVDYNENDENDSIEHRLKIDSLFNMTKNRDYFFNQSFSKSIDKTLRTGKWEDHDTASVSTGISDRFGKNNKRGIDFRYSCDHYKDENEDDHEKFGTRADFSYWFDVRYGLKTKLSYNKTTFETDSKDKDTYSGSIIALRKFNKQLQFFGEYSHSYSKEGDEKHNIYNPSIGFELADSKYSKFTIGLGVLFNEYNYQDNSQDFFVKADIFKFFNFSRRGRFAISLKSEYEETSEDAASLGFNIYYQGGFNYSYRLMKRAGLNLTGSYKDQRFEEEDIDRIDKTLNLRASLNWTALKWMKIGLTYSYKNFDTDSPVRDDYEENRGILSISLAPSRASRLEPGEEKTEIESRIYK